MVQSILKTIEKLNQLQEELIILSQKKRERLIQGNVEQLSELVQEEARIVKVLAEVEEEREEQVRTFLQKQQVSKHEITLSDLLGLLPDSSEKKQLQIELEKLQKRVGELQEANHLNTKLITDSLHFIQYSLDVLTDPSTEEVNYQSPVGSKMQGTQAERRSFFDTKA